MTKEQQLRELREARFERSQVEAEKERAIQRGRELMQQAGERVAIKKGRPSKGQPWKELGMSKATYFRKQKRGS